MSAQKVKAFSAQAAKVVAGIAARYGACYGLAFAARHGLVPASWESDPHVAVKVALVLTMVVYEVEELVWQRWGIDIPAIIARIGVAGLDAGRALAAGPVPDPPQNGPQDPPAPPPTGG